MRKSIVEEIKPDALDLVRARRSDFWGRLRKVEELLRLVEVRVDELSRARSMTPRAQAEVKIRGQRRILEDVLKRLDEIFLVTRTSRIIDHHEARASYGM